MPERLIGLIGPFLELCQLLLSTAEPSGVALLAIVAVPLGGLTRTCELVGHLCWRPGPFALACADAYPLAGRHLGLGPVRLPGVGTSGRS